MKKLFQIVLCLVVVLFYSCKSEETKILERMIGKEVQIPLMSNAILEGKDTVMSFLEEMPQPKLIIYYGPNECSSCNATKLYEWEMVTEFAEATGDSFTPMFLFASSGGNAERADLEVILKSLRLKYPVYLDHDKLFQAGNDFIPESSRYHVFLLDCNNKIVLVGNPLNNPVLWELYKKKIIQLTT